MTYLRGDGFEVVVVCHFVVLQDVYHMTWSRFPESCRFVICEKNKCRTFLCLSFVRAFGHMVQDHTCW